LRPEGVSTTTNRFQGEWVTLPILPVVSDGLQEACRGDSSNFQAFVRLSSTARQTTKTQQLMINRVATDLVRHTSFDEVSETRSMDQSNGRTSLSCKGDANSGLTARKRVAGGWSSHSLFTNDCRISDPSS
jgi:hypothetical protein